MLLALLAAVLGTGALTSLFAAPRRLSARVLASLAPLAALLVLLLPLPLGAEIHLAWTPASLFPEPLRYAIGPSTKLFAFSLLALFLGLQWTDLARRPVRRAARAFSFLMCSAGLAAFFSADGLALLLSWAWMDLLSFATLLLLRAPGDTPQDERRPNHRPVAALAMSSLSTLLLLVAFLPTLSRPGLSLGDSFARGTPTLAVLALVAASILRLGLLPSQLTLARFTYGEGGIDLLLRLLPPASALSLLAQTWSVDVAAGAGRVLPWVTAFAVVGGLLAATRWSAGVQLSPGRPMLVAGLLALAWATLALGTQFRETLEAAAALVLLGGAALLLYRGRGSWQRWSAAWPVTIALVVAGAPFTPGGALLGGVYGSLVEHRAWGVLLAVVLMHILLVAGILRTAFESGEDLPAGEKLVWLAYYGGLAWCELALVGGPILLSGGVLAFPPPLSLLAFAIVLAGAGAVWVASRRLQTHSQEALNLLERLTRIDWLPGGLNFLARGVGESVRAVDDVIGGEGAILWALGIAVLVWIVLRGA